MLHDSLHTTDLDGIEVATIEVFPTNCDIFCVRCMSTLFQVIDGLHTIPLEQEMRPNASATKNKIVLLSRHVKLFHKGIQQRLGGFATRVIRVEQIIDMGDRDKGVPTIELIEIVPFPKHSRGLEICSQVCLGSVDTRSDLRRKFHRYSLEPRAPLQIHILVAVDVSAS